MIVKKIKVLKNAKPKAWQIADLVDYIRAVKHKNPAEKVAYTGHRGFFSNTHGGQKLEMVGLASESVQSKMPVTHWLFSWKENEQPNTAHVEEIVDIFLEKMGLADHQTIYALHHDTENYHLHIAVNRTHPETCKVIQPHKGFDINAAHKILAHIEQKQGWQSENSPRYTALENGEVARVLKKKEVKPTQTALNFEQATGEKSAQRIAQERGHSVISTAKTWEELHEKLAQVGLRFVKKGSGAVVFVPTSSEDIAVKASSIDRKFSMGKLCKRLGEFVEGKYTDRAEKTSQNLPEPVSSVNVSEWQEYQVECANIREKARDISAPSAEKIALMDAKTQYGEARKSAIARLKKYGLSILNIAQHCLRIHYREILHSLGEMDRRTTQKQFKKPRFETWLRSRGHTQKAELWRYRRNFEIVPQKIPQERIQAVAQKKPIQNMPVEAQAFDRYAKAVNADLYRVTCIKMGNDGGKKTFILDKKDGVTKGFTPQELQGRMREMLRLQARGENMYYTPLSEDKHHILIDDMSKESVEKFYADGFRPAVILESSPRNYQCILTIPKLHSAFDRDVGNRLTERLNKEYGDKKLSGCIHPHRAPAFGNLKPKHQREDGSFPRVKLLRAEKTECGKAFAISHKILREHEEALKSRKAETHARPPVAHHTPMTSSTSAYYAHYDNIRKHMHVEDFSRLDAMIALRMRATGHSPQAVMDAVMECAPAIRTKEGRNWQHYAERTVKYAFGVAGDVALRKYERYYENWQNVELSLQDRKGFGVAMRRS